MNRKCKNLAKRKASDTRNLFYSCNFSEGSRKNKEEIQQDHRLMRLRHQKETTGMQTGHVSLVPTCWAI
jgi:hypothetical protein